jgi:hypothetical protein
VEAVLAREKEAEEAAAAAAAAERAAEATRRALEGAFSVHVTTWQ